MGQIPSNDGFAATDRLPATATGSLSATATGCLTKGPFKAF